MTSLLDAVVTVGDTRRGQIQFKPPRMYSPLGVAYAALVVLSGAGWGLASLWATSSQRPFWLRLLAVGFLLGLFLFIPAYEPILFFALQTIIVGLGIFVWRWQSGLPLESRFSLRTLLLVMVVAGLLLSVAVRVEHDSVGGWMSLLGGAFAFALVSLFAAWGVSGSWKRKLLAMIGVAVLAVPAGSWDPGMITLFNWDIAFFGPGPYSFSARIANTLKWLYAVCLPLYLLMFLLLTLFMICWRHRSDPNVPLQNVSMSGAIVLLLLIACPLLWVFANIPPPIKSPVSTDGPDGYEVFSQARSVFVPSAALDDWSVSTSNQQLAGALAKNQAMFAEVRKSLDMPFHIERHEIDTNRLVTDAQFMRSVARALSADAELARREQRISDAMKSSIDAIRLGRKFREANYMMGLVGGAVEAMGVGALAKIRKDLDADQSAQLVSVLTELDSPADPEKVSKADRVWALQRWGWRTQVWLALSHVIGVDEVENAANSWKQMIARRAAVNRLLLVEAAIRGYRDEHQRLPDSLLELDLPRTSLVDPQSTDNSPIRYRVTETGYELYSVGNDGKDNGGVPIPDNSHWGEGDYVLDVMFPD